jgi:tetratricopeptide (TPR) repeat protein
VFFFFGSTSKAEETLSLDWRSVPGNEHAFERLRDLVQSGKAVSFVGAGASAGLYPLWATLIKQLSEQALKRGRADTATRAAWLSSAKDHPDQAVRSIKQALGEAIYADILRKIFQSRSGIDGKSYTPVQELLMRLPFRGHVTTNFDPGLLEARRELRPDSQATGFGTWQDLDAVERWNNGEIFAEHSCPILFAHGIYDRHNTVVLGSTEYRDAYYSAGFRQLLLNLWRQAHLVFIGFSFSDNWVTFVANEVLAPAAQRTEPRHVALIGLREDDDYAPYMRDFFLNQFYADVLFYIIRERQDGAEAHAELREILDALAAPLSSIPPPQKAPPAYSVQPSQKANVDSAPPGSVNLTSHAIRASQSPDGPMLARIEEQKAFRQLLRSHGTNKSVVLVHGPGGYGKTTLCEQLLKIAKNEFELPCVSLDWDQLRPQHASLVEVMRIVAEKLQPLRLEFPSFWEGSSYWNTLFTKIQRHRNAYEDLTEPSVPCSEWIDQRLTSEEREWRHHTARLLSQRFVQDINDSVRNRPGARIILFDTYELIDYRSVGLDQKKPSKVRKTFCHDWVVRLLWEISNDILFLLSGREDHSTTLRATFSGLPPREGLEPPIVTNFRLGRFKFADVRQALRDRLSLRDDRRARDLLRYSGGIPILVMLLIQDVEQTLKDGGEWSAVVPDDVRTAEPSELLTKAVDRLLRFVLKDPAALLTTYVSAITQLGENVPLERQALEWALSNWMPADNNRAAILDSIFARYSSLFTASGVLHPEIRDVVARLLAQDNERRSQPDFVRCLTSARDALVDRIAALEASAAEPDTGQLDPLYGTLLNLEPWIDKIGALRRLVHLILLRVNPASVRRFALGESVEHLPNADLTPLEELLPHLERGRLTWFLGESVRREYVELLKTVSHQNLLSFLRSLPHESLESEALAHTVKLTIIAAEVVIHGRSPRRRIDEEKVEDGLTELMAAIVGHSNATDLERMALLNSWICFSSYLASRKKAMRQKRALNHALIVAEELHFGRIRLLAKLNHVRARVAIATGDPDLAHASIKAAISLDQEDPWLLQQDTAIRSQMREHAKALVGQAKSELEKSRSLTKKAVSFLELAVQFDPDSPDLLQLVTASLRRGGRHDRALAAAERLINARPMTVHGYLGKGLTLYELGRFTEAKDCFVEALRHEEAASLRDLNVFTNLGHVERMLGNFEAAKDRYETRIKLGKQKIESIDSAPHLKGQQKLAKRQRLVLRHVQVCLAYARLGLGGNANRQEAQRLLEEVLAADPSYHQAAAGLFLLYPDRRDLLEHGLRSCNERMAKAPGDLSYPFHRAEMELLKGDLSKQRINELFLQAVQQAGSARGFAEESISFLKLAILHVKNETHEAVRGAIEILRKGSGSPNATFPV